MTIAVPPVWRRIADIAATLAWSVPLAFALAALSGSGHRWPDLLAQFVVPVTVAAAGYAVVVMALRLRLASWCGLPVLVLLMLGGGPQAATSRSEAGAIRVYSANLHVVNTDSGAVRRSVAKAEPDIVVLVEVSDEVATQLNDILARQPYRIATARVEGPSGAVRTVIASRWPIQTPREATLEFEDLYVQITTPIGQVSVVAAHLTRPWPYQYQWGQLTQARTLASRIEALKRPIIVAGDFNSVSSGRVGRQIERELDLHPAKGLAGTWPSALPAWLGVTIDQVWASPDLVFVSRRIGLDNGSDHRPVVTELRRVRP